mgnify:CR=1 FL=1
MTPGGSDIRDTTPGVFFVTRVRRVIFRKYLVPEKCINIGGKSAVTLPSTDRFNQAIIDKFLYGPYGLTAFHTDITGKSFIARIRLPILAGILTKFSENELCC